MKTKKEIKDKLEEVYLKINEIEKEYDDLQYEAENLEELLKKCPSEIWEPKEGEEYYFIQSTGNIRKCANVDTNWKNAPRIEYGNYFKTKEEARKHMLCMKYTNLLRKYVEEHSEPIDWEDVLQEKYRLAYSFVNKRLKILSAWLVKNQGEIYASDKKVLEDAIKFVGEENVKKYIFGVEV